MRALALRLAILALLPVVAVLQYRWIGQLSRAEQESMQATLRAATIRFSQDFNGELARAAMAFQAGRPPLREDDFGFYAERFARWSAAAPNPRLVRDFYLTEGANLFRFNRATERFDPVPWPERFSQLRLRLESRLRHVPGAMEHVDEELPALVFPRRRFPSPPVPPPVLIGWSIAELDLDFIRNDFLPELVQRHYAGPDGSQYQVQIVSRADPRRIIFQAGPDLPAAAFAAADATAPLLDFRPEAGPRPRGSGLPAEVLPRPEPEPPPFPPPPEGRGAWRVLVRHRLGSLATAVAQARHRNLAIAFATLLLMASSIAMLIVSTQRAQKLARLQVEFVAGVSHELRTPLAVIRSAAENLADGVIAGEQQIRRYGAVIRDESRRLAGMVEQALLFSRSQTGRMKFDFHPVSVPDIVERAVAACQPELDASGCVLEKHIDPDLPALAADANALTQALRNLVSNALQYAKDGGWVAIHAEALAEPPELEVRVQDKGPGIDAADLPHIFDPFYRGRAVAAQIHGAGLGLSLVKRIVEGHGGTVVVQSAPGKGACFTLRIPAAVKS